METLTLVLQLSNMSVCNLKATGFQIMQLDFHIKMFMLHFFFFQQPTLTFKLLKIQVAVEASGPNVKPENPVLLEFLKLFPCFLWSPADIPINFPKYEIGIGMHKANVSPAASWTVCALYSLVKTQQAWVNRRENWVNLSE